LSNPIAIERLPLKYEGSNRGARSPDGSVHGDCEESQFGDHAVWFSYTASGNIDFGAWVSGSTGYGELWAYQRETSGSLRYIDCSVGPYTDALWFPTQAGSTYLILLTTFAHQGSGGRGGPFTIEFEEVPPIPEVTLTIDRDGVALGYGANFSGSASCSSPLDIDLEMWLRQESGASGFGYHYNYECRRRPLPWFVEAPTDDPANPLVAGPADGLVLATACVLDDVDDGRTYCDGARAEATVDLLAIEEQPTLTPSPPVVAPTDGAQESSSPTE
jgi:hypothetical protein